LAPTPGRKHFSVEIIAAWEPDDTEGARHRAWADRLSTALAPHALPGGYPGQLGPDNQYRIKLAYGENYARPRAAKARFDPSRIFSTPHPTAAETDDGRKTDEPPNHDQSGHPAPVRA
jgi:hypothetical protein